MELDRIVIGIDFSEPSLAAARWTARHFAPDAELILVHSIEIPRPPGYLEKLLGPAPELVENAREGAERRLRELAGELDGARVRLELREGRPSDRIAEVADSVRADVIVVGEHGHHRGFGDILGSTAERLTRSAPAPVLLARRLRP
nr:universal stress protein [Gemmatimonadota bacterium]